MQFFCMSSSNNSSSGRPQRPHSEPNYLGNDRYLCQRTLGSGTYGKVLQCLDQYTNKVVAVKVSQKEPAYIRAAHVEYDTLRALQERTKYTVRAIEKFEQRGYVCIVMEYLSQNLFELGQKRVKAKGEMLYLDELRQIMYCVLSALTELHRMGLMHCDVKPENIMFRKVKSAHNLPSSGFLFPFTNSPNNSGGPHLSAHQGDQENTGKDFLSSSSSCSPVSGNKFGPPSNFPSTHVAENPLNSFSSVREGVEDDSITREEQMIDFTHTCLIDYGAVRRLNDNTYFHIQSMWYRAPEVLCNVPYTQKIDSWSMGCLLFEMYTGHPLFAGKDPEEQLQLITDVVGSFPHLRDRNPRLDLTLAVHSHQQIVEILFARLKAARRLTGCSKSKSGDAGWKATNSVVGSSLNSNSGGGSMFKLPSQDVPMALSSSKDSHPSLVGSGVSNSSSENATPLSSTLFSELGFSPSPFINDADSAVIPEANRRAEALYVDLMANLLSPDEHRRLSCEKALDHQFFTAFSSPPDLFSRGESGMLCSGNQQQRHFPTPNHLGGCGDSSRCCSNSGTVASSCRGGAGGGLSRVAPSFSSGGGGDGLSSSNSLFLPDHSGTPGTMTLSSLNSFPVPGGCGLILSGGQGVYVPPSTCPLPQLPQTVMVASQFPSDGGLWASYPNYSTGMNNLTSSVSGAHQIAVPGSISVGSTSLPLSTPTTSESIKRSTAQGNSPLICSSDLPSRDLSSPFISSPGGMIAQGSASASFPAGDSVNDLVGGGGGKSHPVFVPVRSTPVQEIGLLGIPQHGTNREVPNSHRNANYSYSSNHTRDILSEVGGSEGGGTAMGNSAVSTISASQNKQELQRPRGGLRNISSLHLVGNMNKVGFLESSQFVAPLNPSSPITTSNGKGQCTLASSKGNISSTHPPLSRRS